MTVRSAPGFAPAPTAPPAGDGRRGHGRRGPDGANRSPDSNGAELGPSVALAALTVVSALAFSRVFTTAGWVLPVLVMTIGAHAFSGWLRQRRVPLGVALSVAIVAVGLVGCYLVLPADLTWGLPLGHMDHAVGDALRQAGNAMRSDITPVPASHGYSLLVVWGSGLAAVLADLLAFRLRAPLQALAPAFALFLTASAIGTARGRGWTVGLEVAAMVVFLLVERAASGRRRATWLGGRGAGSARTTVRAGALTAAITVVAAVALTPAIPSREGDGVLGWRDPPGSGGGSRITPSPFDDLRTRLLDNPDTVVMTVQSPQPSYWRLTSLNDFDGTVWSSNDSYQSVGGRLPGVEDRPGTKQVTERFSISALDSIWLPTGFDPEVVAHHVGSVSWDPVSGSLISSKATSNGETYTVEASEQLADLSPALLNSVPALTGAELTQDVALPANIPTQVAQLARKITAGDTTEYAKAYALEQYFHRAPFIYTTDPLSDDSASALYTFLFQTHQGYCQQFAGAYAVLARDVGLPTRIAVGFETGTLADGVYKVTDANAHAWPEVWFPTVGWVPFEPTPGRQVPNASYTGRTSAPQNPPTTATPSTTVPASQSAPVTQPKFRTPVPSAGPATTSAHHSSDHTWIVIGLVVGLVAILAAGWTLAVASIRTIRWRRRRNRARHPRHDALASSGALAAAEGHDPAAQQRVLVAWAETAELLAWWRLRRRPDETVMEFAERATRHLHALALGDVSRDQLRELAGLVQQAEFSGVELDTASAQRAEQLAQRAISRLRRAAPRSRRIEHLLDPRHALHPVTVETASKVAAGRRPS